jgi:hypothetical protein
VVGEHTRAWIGGDVPESPQAGRPLWLVVDRRQDDVLGDGEGDRNQMRLTLGVARGEPGNSRRREQRAGFLGVH